MKLKLQKADSSLFAKFFATYYTNIWFRQTWDRLVRIASEVNDVYWVTLGETKIAGVIIEENSLSCLFTIPPYKTEIEDIVNEIINFIGVEKQIEAYCVLDNQLYAFQDIGFKFTETRSCMIRPMDWEKVC